MELHLSLHMQQVSYRRDGRLYWLVDDNFGNLIPVPELALVSANYSFMEVIVWQD